MRQNVRAVPLGKGTFPHVGITKPDVVSYWGPNYTHPPAAFHCTKQTAFQRNHGSHNISAKLGPNFAASLLPLKLGADNCDPWDSAHYLLIRATEEEREREREKIDADRLLFRFQYSDGALASKQGSFTNLTFVGWHSVQERRGCYHRWTKTKKKKLHALSPRANYTDRETAACRRSDCQLLRIKGATWSAWRIPKPYSRVSRQEPLLFYQVAPQLYSRGWVDPVPDPLFFLVVPGIEPGPPDL
jgi:hypothetical protein